MKDTMTGQTMFRCKFVEKNLLVKENFLRAANSEAELLKELQAFDYGAGEWEIIDTEADYNDVDY